MSRLSSSELSAPVCVLIVLLLGQWQLKTADGAEETTATDKQPPFVQPVSESFKKFKIISEVIDEHETVSRTHEEYVDLTLGKASFVTNGRDGNLVRHLDADEALCFTYSPYRCLVEDMKLLTSIQLHRDLSNTLNSMSSETMVNLFENGALDQDSSGQKYADKMLRPTKPKPLRLFGVSGLWLAAASKPKKFNSLNLIYSATTDAYKPAYVWHFYEGDFGVGLYFSVPVSSEEPNLEMIKITSISKKTLLRTINILAIERSLPFEVYDNILSVPLGYGCFSALSDAALGVEAGESPKWAELVQMRRAYVNRHAVRPDTTWVGRAELEVTATTLVAEGGQATPMKRSSDTFTVELAQTSSKTDQHSNGTLSTGPFIKLIRWRNTREDKKLVMNNILQTKFTVDMLRGTCEMAHFTAMEQADRERVLVKFANGAQFDVNLELFSESDDLHFVKVTSGRIDGRKLHHYEGTAASKELIDWVRTSTGVTEEVARRTRVVRSYTLGEDSLELVSMTIWLLNEARDSIVESYQIYVIDYREEDGSELAEDRARQFDISYECYLENELMLQNRDFAWFQLSYPVSQRLLGVVADNSQALKQMFFERYVDDIARVPKIELLLEADQFKIRTLLLDFPPVELIYDKLNQVQLKPSTSLDHDQTFMEPDLKHCSHLCRQQHCTVMSYCSDSKSCILSKRQVYNFTHDSASGPIEMRENFEYVSGKMCETYKITAVLERRESHKHSTLVSILARVQHQNYDVQVDLPAAPDEITLSENESGLSEEERQLALNEYETKVYDLLEKDNRLPELAFAVKLAGNFFFLLPNKFELERDPLDEFQLHSNQLEERDEDGNLMDFNDSDDKVPHFHKGKLMSRFNVVVEHKVSFHSYRGLNYDQCATACWDGKCGTFSYCEAGGECILSSAKTVGHAQALGIIIPATDCFIAQRDFLGNFVKFSNIYRPQVYKTQTTEPVMDPSECALDCVAETNFRCMSFQFCATSNIEGKQGGGQCYFQASHHSLNEEAPKPTGCDHYARSQLADFVRLDARRVTSDVVQQLKTNSYNHLTVFGCAEKCSNELIDCTAFQFCHHPHKESDNAATLNATPIRECLTIESKITPKMLKALNKTDSATIVAEAPDGEQIVKTGDFLTYEADCQVFSLRKESSQAHLRDLAFGGLMTVLSSSDGEGSDEGAGESGSRMGVLGAFLLYLSVGAVSTAATCGTIILMKRNDYVRRQLARFRVVNY